MAKVVKIGCSAGFWGDSVTGAFQLINKAEGLNYLVADYLAEVTMGLLARMKSQGARGGMGEGGYVSEFVHSVWKPLMKKIMEKNIKIVCNAGGMNPKACKEEIEKIAAEAGIEVKVAAVLGDDLLDKATDLKEKGHLKAFSVEEAEEPILPDNKVCLSFNAYIGARPIAFALSEGAQIVITGRCTDSAMVLGPLMYEFQWKETDFDLLAAGSLGGHIIECGCQCTGGNFTDWRKSCFSPNGGWKNIGFPIVEFSADGSFVVTKPPLTGGIVSFGSVAEQIVYEIHNAREYILPDVILDFTGVKLEENFGGENRVLVKGAKGYAPTEYYKISGTFFDGYWLSAELLISGFEAKEKAVEVATAIIERSRAILKSKGIDDFIATNIETLGSEHTYGAHSSAITKEIVLRISAHHEKMEGLKVFGKELAPSATGMAPGITGAGGRPHSSPLIKHYSCLIHKSLVPVTVLIGSQSSFSFTYPAPSPSPLSSRSPLSLPPPYSLDPQSVEVPLITICYGRSGDKGDVANIGLIAREPRFFPLLLSSITPSKVQKHFEHYVKGTTVRYELPGINALNFVLTKSLGGGGLGSLNIDKQGKSYAQILLTMPISVPKSFLLPSSSL